LIIGGEAHDGDGVDKVRVALLEGRKGLVEDDCSIRIIDRAVAADDELGWLNMWELGKATTEFSI
jgi:hypothetical protein